ncbi:Peptidase S8/S53 domain superfamily [Arabidopsis suecica]|uniref:Peptidase S8/S53 domain superfamily n=1 Tax=Arabidopsis suecica TaxID=45249 RepID=A0A8T1XUA8_ARASU|nr:Peptidase S8/S53 domain superfamily [Arabidopsis suecica]
MFTRDVSANDNRQVYIVYMGTLPEIKYSPPSHHLSMLQKLVGTNAASNLLIRSYKRSFNGFAANLSQAESQKLQNMKEVVSVFPSKSHELTTTRSWDFVGFGERAKRESVKESDVIVGVIDSGIWPESESFDDKGFGPPPKKWKGSCKGGLNFTCNNKLIGARFYNKFSESARDEEGHGTHTASTAAGNAVQAASFYGLAQGTARGGVPSARIAAYKVCFKRCNDVDILAAFDDAIADGVDVISISISVDYVSNLLNASVAIGSFHAMLRGIITAGSAGNNGPDQGSVANVSPWMITVAASATDRSFIDRVVLGNGKALTGISVNPFNLNGTKFPIVYGQNVSRNCSQAEAGFCSSGCVDSDLVKGKIVLCDDFLGYREAYLAGAIGAIVQNTLFPDSAFVFPFPASSLGFEDYKSIKSYIESAEPPQAEILRTEETVDREAPYVPSFSSRGPSFVIQNLLKPDVSAPGLEILAAFSPVASPSSLLNPEDKRSVRYSVMSGTSMACPHVAGVAAYVKSFHPDWSPSAIKSAIMTTATPMNLKKNPEQEFAYGSGQINPTKASDPGLVYEVETDDYLKMLCAEGFDSTSLTKTSGQNVTCSQRTEVKDLNYPTMTTFVSALDPFNVTFKRTVTNVGFPNSTYKASVVSLQQKIQISIEPEILRFGFLKEKKSFVVTISGKELKDGSIVSSSVVWSDGSHSVRSPIVAYSIQP